MSTKSEWIDYCLGFSSEQADFYSGCRKILRGRVMIFQSLDDSIQLEDAGYTSHKLRYLDRAYLHEESLRIGVDLWAKRRVQNKYGSIGVTCYNVLVKNEGKKSSKRASILGPCIQSFIVTYLNKHEYAVDVFYRSTEVLKKFPADLVFLRDRLLAPFDFSGMRMTELRCSFANITTHCMYWITLVPNLVDPIAELEAIRARDPFFWNWILKWSARYVCPEFHRGIAKFAQALRVNMDANKRIKPEVLEALQVYIRANHPPLKTRFAEANEALGQDVNDEDVDS